MACPFGLVYEYMEGLDLGQFVQNEPKVGRLRLVFIPVPTYSLSIPLTSPTVDRHSSDVEPYA